MATRTLKLTPKLRNFATEGGLDTSVSGGVSIQRTGYIDVKDTVDSQRKIVVVADGGTFDDDVFQLITTYPAVTIV